MEMIFIDEKNLDEWQEKSRKNVLALGFFDGVHKGHKKVIHTAANEAQRQNAKLDVMSFFPHPKTVLTNGKTQVDYLMPLAEKARVLAEMGVDRFYIVKFTKAFASLSPEAYVQEYLTKFQTVHAAAGYDFSYGFKGQGTIDRLAADAGYQLGVSKVEKVEYQKQKISSTRIREAIMAGKVSEVRQLLGRKYTTRAAVSGGRLSLKEHYLLPQDGIYDCLIDTGSKRHRTQIYVDQDAHKISFTKQCLLNEIDQHDIAITWEKRVASHSFYQMAAQ